MYIRVDKVPKLSWLVENIGVNNLLPFRTKMIRVTEMLWWADLGTHRELQDEVNLGNVKVKKFSYDKQSFGAMSTCIFFGRAKTGKGAIRRHAEKFAWKNAKGRQQPR